MAAQGLFFAPLEGGITGHAAHWIPHQVRNDGGGSKGPARGPQPPCFAPARRGVYGLLPPGFLLAQERGRGVMSARARVEPRVAPRSAPRYVRRLYATCRYGM